jgi:hypothetical protein
MQKMDKRPTCSTLAAMRVRSRQLLLVMSLAPAAGCGVMPVPGLLPTWAADTLDTAELETPRPGPTRPQASRPEPSRPEPDPDPEPAGGYRGGDEEAAAWVEAELRDRGLRFGTDGTVSSLHTYVRVRHGLVAAGTARPGDILFFDLSGRNRCGDHAGVVDEVDATGRISFRESRGGIVRLSYAHPQQPASRRAADGRVLNTFLRIRRVEDPPQARYLAGSLLCGVGRIQQAVVRQDQDSIRKVRSGRGRVAASRAGQR